MDSPGLIPLFPLGLVLYPSEVLPLHIFETRYRDMMRDCMRGERIFGIVLIRDGRMSNVGCTARIQEVVRRHQDGRMDIVVEGEARFRVHDVSRVRSYLQADARVIEEERPHRKHPSRERVITQHLKLLEMAGRTPRPSAYEGRAHLSYFIGLNAGLSLQQKQDMLELANESARIEFLVQHLSEFIPRVEQAETLRRTITSNGHFPNFPKPE
jgi:ATP-dependent Lon protease